MLERIRQRKLLRTVSSAAAPSFRRNFSFLSNRTILCGCLLDRRNEKSVRSIFDLMADSADVAADYCRTFPHRFGDRQSKSLPDGFLQYYRGAALKRVDQSGILPLRMTMRSSRASSRER